MKESSVDTLDHVSGEYTEVRSYVRSNKEIFEVSSVKPLNSVEEIGITSVE